MSHPSRRTALLVLAATFVPAAALAKTVQVGGRPVFIPDGWTVLETGARLLAASPDQTSTLVATERAVPLTGLAGVDAAGFIEDNLDDVSVASDKVHSVRGQSVRTLTGQGSDEGQQMLFWFRLAGGKTNLVTALVSIPASGIQTVPQRIIDRILDSISGG